MDASKQFLKDEKITTYISFKETPVHTVTLISDELDSMKDKQGKTTKGIRYTVKEDGQKKEFFTGSPALISKLSGKKPGDIVTIEMKSKKTADGNFISVFEVRNPDLNEELEEEAAQVDADERKDSKREEVITDGDIPF